ncbi:MAG: hypothetical protein LQ343_003167 [Gyalolechia ehrenbergii]|nr:MAG: hypothetical protein LQ343_003167 [Gyalolechia ehrenbergii]
MRWPWSPTSEERDEKKIPPLADVLSETHWSHYRDPRNIVPVVVLTGLTLSIAALYRSYLRRIPQAINIEPRYWRKRSLFGRVTSVGDADNFRLFHTPGGRLAGWEILPWRKVPKTSKELKEKTVHIRLAGIDAPELAHFGKPAQLFSKEAFDFLNSYILHRRVRAYVYRRDQYDRAVATVYVRKWLLRRDVGLQMLKKGLATVYEAKSGAEFGELEERYRSTEKWAKLKKKGMWSGNKRDYESPRNYKTRTGQATQSA